VCVYVIPIVRKCINYNTITYNSYNYTGNVGTIGLHRPVWQDGANQL